ncbi:conserved exported hypothetical protein [Candidatus Sulfopaludibacter sp. SbA3]|nr:conserved exported hypothetical protein [Candidatus Sulfopaludibacter sp. SbA3]
MMLRFAGFLLCSCAFAQDAPKPQMTARELFYSAAQTPPPAAKPAEAPRKSQKSQPTLVATRSDLTDDTRRSSALPGGAKLITVAAGMPSSAPPPASGTPLGLKYSLLKLTGGEMQEVPVNSVFHAEDRIQFRVETNGPGYLYIISQGSSGQWMPMFPSPDKDGGSNHTEGFKTYIMPQKTRFVFDEQAGTEKLFLIFTREKEADLEDMIYSLQGGKAKPVSAPTPAPAPEASRQVMRASIDDQTVGRLRTSYARDLIIEAVDPATPGGEKKENAVYVVNPTGSVDSKLVADLLLVHK